ncbi:FUSC family protein [Celerinatantimonas diazotrophica]|uniref:Putative membrane protein YccC n=1 Tax=Celerinatantimonas diazotrophica TaxID=412034 RepID=A0A4V6NE29_9GAMM|nr:FUSC family protein [Celerinatantimonas diazotrophica]TCK47691.1 putative membrane protein YccC [Celerinatantimonas diazotrophica]CAG9296685.1 p-hydroxybenzoic acid efflux pump subunit AaeB [Celerinatantimonas diazotrophica]
MGIVLQTMLMPQKRSVLFALKGVIAMAMALSISIYLQLDRPYWAVISAVFLQIRPESGLVAEKALCQIVGTIIGGLVGIFILANFIDFPYLGLAFLGIWLSVNSGLSAMIRRINFIYGLAIASVTAEVIIVLSVAQPSVVSSAYIFNVAQARMSEIIIGAICAGLVSHLLWPIKVKHVLQQQSKKAINQTLEYLAIELDPDGSHEERHQHIDQIMQTLSEVSDDSSAVTYEGPEGPGRARAANQICHKILSLLSVIQIFGRLQRRNAELVTPVLAGILKRQRDIFIDISHSDNFEVSYQRIKFFRRELAQYRMSHFSQNPLEARLLKITLDMASDLIILLRAFRALENRDTTLLHAPRMQPYRDPLIGLTRGGRSAIMFFIGSFIWVETASYAALMIMILPVIFSIMLDRLPLMLVSLVLRRMLVGVAISIPVSIFFAINLIAQSSDQLGQLLLILAGPFFVGLIALANRPTLPYGLGFLIPFTILVRPSAGVNMSRAFHIDYTLSSALGIFVGVTMLYWLFQLFEGPGVKLMVKRIFNSTYQDILLLGNQQNPTSWFNRRMADRLLRLTAYDQRSKTRIVTDLGLTGLNIGNVIIRFHSFCTSLTGVELKHYDDWNKALADAYLLATRGKYSEDFDKACQQLNTEIAQYAKSMSDIEMIQGMFQRMSMTLKRSAQSMEETLALTD